LLRRICVGEIYGGEMGKSVDARLGMVYSDVRSQPDKRHQVP